MTEEDEFADKWNGGKSQNYLFVDWRGVVGTRRLELLTSTVSR